MYRLVCGKVEGFDERSGYYVKECASSSDVYNAIRTLRCEGYRIFLVYEVGSIYGCYPFEGDIIARVDDIASLHNGLMALK